MECVDSLEMECVDSLEMECMNSLEMAQLKENSNLETQLLYGMEPHTCPRRRYL